MPVNLTPSNIFPTNFRAPDDGDPANGSTFQQCFQDAADAATNLKGRADGHDMSIGNLELAVPTKVTASSARYLNGTSTTDDPVHWTASIADAGFSVVSDSQVQVPAAGRYLVAWGGRVQSDDATNAVEVGLTLKVGGADAGFAQARRFSTTTSHSLRVQGVSLVDVSDPATERITVALTASAGTPSLSGTNTANLTIVRVSA